MEKAKVKMKIKDDLVLRQVIEEFLTKTVVDEKGNKTNVEREIPFRLKYRLDRNKVMLDKYTEFFEQQRLLYLAEYGTATDDGQNVEIKDPEKLKLFKQKVSDLLETNVENSIILLEEEDLDQIRDKDIGLSDDTIKVLIGYMTNDVELLEDLATKIELKDENNEENVNG